MHREPLIMVCTCEIAGRVRGKGFPASALKSRLLKGVGWVPTNTMISCFGPIYATPFGTTDDLMLVPDPATEVNVDFGDGSPAEHFFLGDIRHLDGTPWSCCPRDFLRRGLDALKAEAGVDLVSAFEHEFVYTGVEEMPGAAYSLDAFRRQGIFAEALIAGLRSAGTEPDSFMPEYGARQYEITVDPADGIAAADRAVILREITRATAHRLGHRASFAPILDPTGVGNGVHIHFSFCDAANKPVMHDPADPLGLSPAARHFAAGILHHQAALCALTAPTTVSYIRLRPNRWAPTHATLETQDRAAALRICPTLPGAEIARQFNVEYRVADAAASPYIALAAIVWAGVDGITRQRALPTEGPALPATIEEALNALQASPEARIWMGETFHNAYLMHKRGEAASMTGLTEAEQCARYAATY